MELQQLKYTCRLCPHECSLAQGEVGKCLMRKGHYVMPYSTCFDDPEELLGGIPVSTISVEPLGKKPIYKYLKKNTRTLSLGGYGCSLSCDYCQNWKVSQQKPNQITYITSKGIIDLAKKKDIDTVCFTYNEPTLYYPFINNLYHTLKKEGMNLVIKTNAYLNNPYWKIICENVDAMNIDFKGSEKRHIDTLGIKKGTYHKIISNIAEAISHDVHVEISVPIFEDYSDEDVEHLMDAIEYANFTVPIHLLRVFPVNKLKGKPTKVDKIEYFKDKLIGYSNGIYIHNVYGK